MSPVASTSSSNYYDVIIIGGSYAGLSAAMTLGRSLRSVLVMDSGLPCNRFAPHSHNFLTHDGAVPGTIAATARAQVEAYESVRFHTGVATKASQTPHHALFQVSTKGGDTFSAKRLILATGLVDHIMVDDDIIPGIAACWGKTVIHCPFCHGYEFKGEPTAVLVLNVMIAFMLLPLIRNLSNKVTVLTNGSAELTAEQRELCAKNGIAINEDKIQAIVHDGSGSVSSIEFQSVSSLPVKVVYAAALPMTQSSDIATQLGCEMSDPCFVKVTPMQETTVPGVLACGDCTTMFRTVAMAVATGNMAGAVAHKSLIMEEFAMGNCRNEF